AGWSAEHGEEGGDEGTFVVTAWSAEHDGETGIIFLNDWALGDLFSGRERFEARLAKQGFENVRNIATLAELEHAKQPSHGKKLAAWSGPWLVQYPWEKLLGVPMPIPVVIKTSDP